MSGERTLGVASFPMRLLAEVSDLSDWFRPKGGRDVSPALRRPSASSAESDVG